MFNEEGNDKTQEYSLEICKNYSQEMFGIDPQTFNAICSDLDQEETYTKGELKEHIQEWLKEEVK